MSAGPLLYRCENCGAEFDIPIVREWSEWHGDGPPEQWAEFACPECGSIEVNPLSVWEE